MGQIKGNPKLPLLEYEMPANDPGAFTLLKIACKNFNTQLPSSAAHVGSSAFEFVRSCVPKPLFGLDAN